MSTTRIVFIIVCIVVAAILIVVGLIFQRNSPDGRYSATASAGKKRKRGLRLPKNPSSWMTVILALIALVLIFLFSKK